MTFTETTSDTQNGIFKGAIYSPSSPDDGGGDDGGVLSGPVVSIPDTGRILDGGLFSKSFPETIGGVVFSSSPKTSLRMSNNPGNPVFMIVKIFDVK
jgi:hypothetical protein